MPPGLPSHETNTVPSVMPPPAHGLSGALPMVRIADQVVPLSVDVIIRMFAQLREARHRVDGMPVAQRIDGGDED